MTWRTSMKIAKSTLKWFNKLKTDEAEKINKNYIQHDNFLRFLLHLYNVVNECSWMNNKQMINEARLRLQAEDNNEKNKRL